MQHGKYRFIVGGFLVVPLGLYALFVVWPFIQSIYYSFTDWTGLSPDFEMVGFDNYTRMFHDDIFWKSLQHSLLFALLLPLVTIGLALFFAFMINVGGRRRRGRTGHHRCPRLLLLQDRLLLPAGAVDRHRRAAVRVRVQPGQRSDQLRAARYRARRRAAAVAGRPGPGAVVRDGRARVVHDRLLRGPLLGRHGSIPADLYEAALLDGASRFTTFFRITLPLLWDTVQSGWVYMGILALGAESFAVVQIMTTGPGGPRLLDHRHGPVRVPEGVP